MKLPDKKDPSGNLMGSWRRCHVLDTLVRYGITISPVGVGTEQVSLSRKR